MRTPAGTIDPSIKPRLRPGLAAEPAGDGVVIIDRLRVGQVVQLSRLGLEIARRLDGTRTLLDVQFDLIRLAGGTLVPLDAITGLVAGLDDALLLDSPRFRDRIGGPVRKPSCIGCYDADPVKLRAQLAELFTAPGGPGLPGERRSPTGRLRAVLAPHMDYTRGNVTYGWAFKELAENTDATVFVVIGTSHYSPNRFTLSRQHFETPLGVAQTDQRYIDAIVKEYSRWGDPGEPEPKEANDAESGLFDDPFAHVPEHSIELEVVLLQFVLRDRPFRIVPLLVGSFGDCVDDNKRPVRSDDVARMIAALKKAEADCPEKVCYVISGDLAHIGPKFGDPQAVNAPQLAASKSQDDAICKQLEAADADGYFGVIAAEEDRRRICGLPPTYVTLQAARPKAGRLLHYQQFVHPEGFESVSFAAATFYG